jgi:cytochrome c biogenesis protein CcmG, thiol:disulfide interchange protein DsbE
MNDKLLFKALLFGALLAGIASVATFTMSDQEKPRLAPVKEKGKRARMPEIDMMSTSGQRWKLSEQKGRIVLVNFWATWCAPCRKETPDLVRLYAKYKGRGVTIAGISLDEDPAKVVPGFAAQYRIEYPLLAPGANSAWADSIESLPTSFLVDPNGRVARSYVGAVKEAELAANIEELLKEVPSN